MKKIQLNVAQILDTRLSWYTDSELESKLVLHIFTFVCQKSVHLVVDTFGFFEWILPI